MGEGAKITQRMADQPCFALYSATNAITRAYRPLLEPLGLTYPQYVVMMTLWEGDGLDLVTLAGKTNLDPSTLTPIVKRLEARGVLSRARPEHDERRLIITVTPLGRELQQDAREVADQMLCIVGIDEDLANALMDTCREILRNLQSPESQGS